MSEQRYEVEVNGEQVVDFTYEGEDRGLPGTPEEPTFIGLQAYGGAKAAFRGIALKPL